MADTRGDTALATEQAESDQMEERRRILATKRVWALSYRTSSGTWLGPKPPRHCGAQMLAFFTRGRPPRGALKDTYIEPEISTIE